MSELACGVCRSVGRRMKPLRLYSNAYSILISPVETTEWERAVRNAQVCWECGGFLSKVMAFQERALRAALALHSRAASVNDVSFSTLCCVKKVGFDMEIVGSDEIDAENMLETSSSVEKQIPQVTFETESSTKVEENQQLQTQRRKKKKTKKDTIRVIHVSPAEAAARRSEMRESDEYISRRHKCETCLVGFLLPRLLEAHNSLKHNQAHPHACDVCRQTFATASLMTSHRRGHFALYACAGCQYTSPLQSSVRRHAAETHASAVQCGICGLEFQTKRKLRYHRDSVHSEPVKCEVCCKTLTNRYSLKQHMLTHTGMPTYECDVCRKVYRGEAGLYSHMRHFHSDQRDTYCAQCDIHFKNNTLYRSHLKRSQRHTTPEQLRFGCSECPKRFITEASLRKHHKYYHMDYVCDICNKRLKNLFSLGNHIKCVHGGGGAPQRVICDGCGDSFKTKAMLTTHQARACGTNRLHGLPQPATFLTL